MIEFSFLLWIAMGKLLGTRWVIKHGTTPSIEWQRLLARFVDFNPEELAGRIVEQIKPNAQGEVWPPEMADVIAMCKPHPQDFGLPTAEQAYRAANHLRWTHPAVYETARRLGVNDVRSRTERQMFPDFEKTYEQVCNEFMQGRTSNWPKRAKPDTGVEYQPTAWKKPENWQERIAELKKNIGPMPASKPRPVSKPINDEEFFARIGGGH